MTFRPQVVAHRGASARAPEHTLAAYTEAVERGAEALECDVRLTADGHLVCVHDPTINRTSDGEGRVSNKKLSDLMNRDFGSWWNPDVAREMGLTETEQPDFDQEVQHVLTLDRLLQLVVDSGNTLELAIETKHPNRYGGYTERAVVDALERYGLIPNPGSHARIRVMSFAGIALRRMRDLSPDLPRVFLTDKYPRRRRLQKLPGSSQIVGPDINLLREHPELCQIWHDNGIKIHSWKIDSRENLDFCVENKVEAVITNRTGDVVEWLAEES